MTKYIVEVDLDGDYEYETEAKREAAEMEFIRECIESTAVSVRVSVMEEA